MTLHQNIRAEFDIWVRDHEGTACAGALKTAFILDQLNPVYEDLGKTIIKHSRIYQKQYDKIKGGAN